MQEEDVAFDDMEQMQEDPVIQTEPLTDTQSTVEDESEFWGRLTPCNFHATILWNGLENAASVITILDKSSNGTFINGEKIGKGQQRLLKDGNEVSFGIRVRSTENNGLYDYRFIFRDLVSSVEKRALFSSYDLSVELGKGSFATVYKALHCASGEWVAVKTKRAGLTAAQASSREINVMEHLRHPNICQLREVIWNANGSIDLVLELIKGGDLLDYILRNEGLSEDVTKHIVYQLCQALAYIHEKGITHHGLKPKNVLLTLDDPPIVKVADFGLTKIVDSMTMLKAMCGTPSYLAPEVVTQQNSSGYDSLVNSWSVGVIMFSMLSNSTPFIDSSVEDLRTRIAERIIEWTQLERLRLSEDALDFLRRLLEYDPRYRMKLSEALEHPWLKDYVFAHPIEYPSRGASSANLTSSLSQDVSMRTADQLNFTGEAEAVSQGSEHLKLNGSTLGVPAAANGNADTKGGLPWRADVPQQAAEAGQAPIEPSWEMVTFAQSQGQSQEQSDNSSEDSMYAPHGPDSMRDAPSTVQIPARLTDDSAMLSNPSSPPEEPIRPEDQDMASLEYVENLLVSWECRCLLLTVVMPEEDHQRLLKAAEAQITTFLTHILDSRAARRVAQELEESSAQSFVDAIQNVLDWGILPDANSRAKARKLMQQVAESGEQLPSSLFITGVTDRDEHPTFGGGFGDVYQASYDGKRVALKRIRTFTADSTTHRNRLQFYKEALVWQGLRHRFILPLLGIDRSTFAPSFCMVSPWMKYGTVLRYLQDRGRGGVNRLLLEITQGLSYLHSLNIIHGDLRGTNILISDDGHACLSDFGLATTFSEADSTAAMTSSSNRAGSARWFAPELIEPKSFGCERFVRTTASDVYAYACVCLELYTGRPPFAHLPDVTAMLRVIAGERPEQPPAVSAALWQLVTAAWVPESHARPSIHKIAAAFPETVPASPA
ncbi:kinase-like domain-containing protein [Mycena olivaceomarginata]|nr:kinase-like domain-containing protein [Mycena olivaceomarginata]